MANWRVVSICSLGWPLSKGGQERVCPEYASAAEAAMVGQEAAKAAREAAALAANASFEAAERAEEAQQAQRLLHGHTGPLHVHCP